ncbi:MAG: asparagine synthase (glutamine-hydrolyzing), partial [Acidobacteria bacterium]|nr:asparagine synthase (glutamine-hydrolyzing) [Acidobacteriota bacterium]
MCGICGIVNFDPSLPVDKKLLERMTGVLAHRGPDDQGFFVEANVGLGHRRLSIIDLGGGRQPIFNEDRSAVIVFNGEIYNYADLTAELVKRGHSFRTRSDTETILHSYDELGDRCVDWLRGMFAFAVWDRRQRRLLLARDRLGVKPLYFYRGETFFAFASEIKALLEVPSVPRQLDMEALDIYLSLRYVPGPRTMFKNIYKLQPGHLLVLDQNRIRIHKYWDIPSGPPQQRSIQEVLPEFQQLLEESVRLRLVAEVPLGVFLSGGLDSSAILAVMSKVIGGERIKTFSVGYVAEDAEEEKSNEFEYARMAARKFGAEHHEFRVSATDFRDAIPDLVWHLDEPLADPSCIPLYFISKLARKHITVVLSGEGADEILAGYYIYRKMLMLENLRRSVGPLGTWLASAAATLYPRESGSYYLRMAGLPLEKRYRGVSRAFLPEAKRHLLRGSDL